jgi:predicted dehydrogenase
MRTIALVGCGRISDRHLKVIAMIPELKLVRVCDRLEDRAQAAASAHDVPTYIDCVEMAKTLKPDIVSILTDSGLHAGPGCPLAPHVQVLVVEKPMALILEDADRLIETCEAHGTKLFVVKQNRFNPPNVALKQAVDEGRFGKMVLGTVRIRWPELRPTRIRTLGEAPGRWTPVCSTTRPGITPICCSGFWARWAA